MIFFKDWSTFLNLMNFWWTHSWQQSIIKDAKKIFWKWTTVNIFTAYLVHEVIYTSNLDMVEYFRKLFVSQKVVTYIYLFILLWFWKAQKVSRNKIYGYENQDTILKSINKLFSKIIQSMILFFFFFTWEN